MVFFFAFSQVKVEAWRGGGGGGGGGTTKRVEDDSAPTQAENNTMTKTLPVVMYTHTHTHTHTLTHTLSDERLCKKPEEDSGKQNIF